MVFSNSQMKLNSSIRLEGSYHIVDWFFPRGLRFSHVFCTDCQGPIYFFVIVADIKRCFFLLTSKCGCRSRMYEESSAKCCHFTEKLRRTVAWSTRLSRLVVTRRALWASLENPPPQPLPAAARAAAVHRGCFFREEGWLTAPCIAHKNRAPMIHGELIYQKWDHNILDFKDSWMFFKSNHESRFRYLFFDSLTFG